MENGFLQSTCKESYSIITLNSDEQELPTCNFLLQERKRGGHLPFTFPSTEERTYASLAPGHQLKNNTENVRDHEFHHPAECHI